MKRQLNAAELEARIARTLLGASLASVGVAAGAFFSVGGLTGAFTPGVQNLMLVLLFVAGMLRVGAHLIAPAGRWLRNGL
jgi:hypothetical protein